MPYCKLSPDEDKDCAAIQRCRRKGSETRVQVCDIYDDAIKSLKKCPLIIIPKKRRPANEIKNRQLIRAAGKLQENSRVN